METMLKLPSQEAIRDHFNKKRLWDQSIIEKLTDKYAGIELPQSTLSSRVTLDFGGDAMAVIYELQTLMTSPTPV
jgi:hypothetical protein